MASFLHIWIQEVVMKNAGDILNDRPHREIFSVVPNQSVLSAAQFMRSKNIGAVAVIRGNLLLGILSERDMLNEMLGPGLDPRDVYVGQIMSQQVTTVSPAETWEECLNKMRKMHCRHLPVVDNGRFIGMISLREVIGSDEAEILDTYLWDRSVRMEETC
jgi:CBS domain-containing protein